MGNSKTFLIVSLFIIGTYSCQDPVQNQDWSEYLGGSDRNHYSALDQINADNVKKLQVAWEYNTGDSGDFQ